MEITKALLEARLAMQEHDATHKRSAIQREHARLEAEITDLALAELSRREQEQTAMAEWEAEDRVRFPAWWECEDARRRAEQAKGGVGDE